MCSKFRGFVAQKTGFVAGFRKQLVRELTEMKCASSSSFYPIFVVASRLPRHANQRRPFAFSIGRTVQWPPISSGFHERSSAEKRSGWASRAKTGRANGESFGHLQCTDCA